MSTPDRIAAAIEAHVRDAAPAPGLAEQVIAQGRARRRRRHGSALAAAATLVVSVGALPSVLSDPNTSAPVDQPPRPAVTLPSPGPTVSSPDPTAPSPDPTVPSPDPTVPPLPPTALDELPIGEGPRTAWLDGKTASFPSARGVGLTGDYRDLLRSTDGWVLLEARAGGASQVTQVVVVTEAGRTGVRVEPVAHVDRGTITDVAVSSDGRQVAWTSSNASPSVGQTTTADLSTGEVLDVSRFNLGGGLGDCRGAPGVAGLTDGFLVEAFGNGAMVNSTDGSAILSCHGGPYTGLVAVGAEGRVAVRAAPGAHWDAGTVLVLQIEGVDAGSVATRVVSATGWPAATGRFSASGGRLLAATPAGETVWVHDTVDGGRTVPLLTLAAGSRVVDLAWEDEDSALMVVEREGRHLVVRCPALGGECELAGEPDSWNGDVQLAS